MSTAQNRNWGRAGVSATDPAVRHVADSEALWFDGQLSRDLTAPVRTPELVERTIPKGTAVEVKAAAYRVQDSTSNRRGRWKIRKDNHRQLVAFDGVYALGVYNPNSKPLPSAFSVIEFVAPDVVEELINGAWSDDAKEGRKAATIPWSSVFAPGEVEP